MPRGGPLLLSIGLTIMCIGLLAGIVSVGVPRVVAPAPLTPFLRFAAVAGVLSFGSAVMYLMHANGGGRPALVAADVAMVLSPGCMIAAVTSFSARGRRALLFATVTVAAAVGVCTALAPEDDSLVIKAAVLALVCGVCATVAARSQALPRRVSRTISITAATFALFSGARAFAGATVGWDSPSGATVFSQEVSTAAAVATVLACGAAIIDLVHLLARHSPPGPHGLSVVVIDDARLLAAAYGSERLMSLVREMRAAAHALDDRAVDVRHGVATSLPSALATLSDQMQNAFGWGPEEIAFLAEPETLRKPDQA